jgi:hypothetical protein
MGIRSPDEAFRHPPSRDREGWQEGRCGGRSRPLPAGWRATTLGRNQAAYGRERRWRETGRRDTPVLPCKTLPATRAAKRRCRDSTRTCHDWPPPVDFSVSLVAYCFLSRTPSIPRSLTVRPADQPKARSSNEAQTKCLYARWKREHASRTWEDLAKSSRSHPRWAQKQTPLTEETSGDPAVALKIHGAQLLAMAGWRIVGAAYPGVVKVRQRLCKTDPASC